ncbi:MAG: TusE/DsrC/DsvC family sulfur relay protein [Alphaproteobacteria bacterium]|nr:TusE/DsrC/DsvC family sulfur relay protein [Alphaproteobacteria bacterium]
MRTRPDIVTHLKLAHSVVDIDEAGYLRDPADWSREFAEHVALQEGIEATETHWQIIAFMRAYLDEHGIAPDSRFTIKFLGKTNGLDKTMARRQLFDIFPYGYVKQACKMAGMKQPRAWSTG